MWNCVAVTSTVLNLAYKGHHPFVFSGFGLIGVRHFSFTKESPGKLRLLAWHRPVPSKGQFLLEIGNLAKLAHGRRDELLFMPHFMDRNLRETKVLTETAQVRAKQLDRV